MDIIISPDVLAYGIPFTAIISLVAAFLPFFKTKKYAIPTFIVLVLVAIASGLGINVMGIHLSYKAFAQDIFAILNFSEQVLQSIYTALFFVMLITIVYELISLILTRGIAIFFEELIDKPIRCLPLVVVFAALGVPAIINAILCWIILFIIENIMPRMKRMHEVNANYNLIVYTLSFVFVFILMINANFSSFFSTHFWQSTIIKSSLDKFAVCIHQFSLALIVAFVYSIIHNLLEGKEMIQKTAPLKYKIAFILDVIRTFCEFFLKVGLIGFLLMLIPIEIFNYKVTSIIASLISLAINIIIYFSVIKDINKWLQKEYDKEFIF